MTQIDASQKEPYFNIAPVTGALVVAFVFLHLFRVLEPFPIEQILLHRYAFVPELFLHDSLLNSYRLVTYAALHGNVLHLTINLFGLLAFGNGVERALGKNWLLASLLFGSVMGVLGHTVLFPQSDIPLIGASAGVSALFGTMMAVLYRGRVLLHAAVVFIAINCVIGYVGMPSQPGLAIAWQAHIFGFLAGIVVAKMHKSKAKM